MECYNNDPPYIKFTEERRIILRLLWHQESCCVFVWKGKNKTKQKKDVTYSEKIIKKKDKVVIFYLLQILMKWYKVIGIPGFKFKSEDIYYKFHSNCAILLFLWNNSPHTQIHPLSYRPLLSHPFSLLGLYRWVTTNP